jgi:hypothetical protein
MTAVVKKLAGIVLPFASALGLLRLMGSDWYEGVVSAATEFVVRMITGT